MPAAIAPLIEKAAQPVEARRFKVATFYSISNCQPGLRGVSLGNFLIKRVGAVACGVSADTHVLHVVADARFYTVAERSRCRSRRAESGSRTVAGCARKPR